MAQKSGAKILLRIDDLDQARVNQEYLQDIFDTLNFLEIPWDEGPRDVKEFEDSWSQLQRIEIYNEAIEKLKEKELLFACTCSRQQMRGSQPCTCFEKHLPLDTENVNWRIITGDNELTIKNYHGEVTKAALPTEMHNFIIRRKDGLPSYQLASVVDDLLYRIGLVVRGEDLWASTVAQHELASALEENQFNHIAFYHHPLLMETGNKKLSKSAGATSVRYLRQQGKKPNDVYTLIATMLGSNKKINHWQQLVEITSKPL